MRDRGAIRVVVPILPVRAASWAGPPIAYPEHSSLTDSLYWFGIQGSPDAVAT